jgi:hypothetical protein
MSSPNGNRLKFLGLIVAAILLIAFNWHLTKRSLANSFAWLARTLEPAAAPSPSPSPAGAQPISTPPPAAPPLANAQSQSQFAVEAYMRKNAIPEATISFLDWSDFSASGQTSTITLRYQVTLPSRPDQVATVRFTVQNGAVVKATLVQTPPAAAPAAAPWAARSLAQTPPPAVIDRFSDLLQAAISGPRMTLQAGDAFSLAQLDQAEQKAREERKPLGFLMVWGVLFDHEADTRGSDSVSALVHFYQVFNQNLVLVFVRHETELNKVPDAVKKGFFGPNEGGYAPNMAVTDATASEFIVEIPYAHEDGAGRDQTFAAGAQTIDQWLATHPDAVPASP